LLPSGHPTPADCFPLMEQEDHLTQSVKALCTKGYKHYDHGDYEKALRHFYQAWLQLPKPQTDFQQAGWVLAAIGDCYYKMKKYPQALEALESCLHCPGMVNSPFVFLRLGQVLLDTQKLTEARKKLSKAYQLGGRKPFQSEANEYLQCISDLIQ